MGIRIGVDTGGTFTDFIVASELGIEVTKVLSVPKNPETAIIEGLERIAKARGYSVKELLHEVEIFIHGTTIATNTVIQRNGPKVGLLATSGFRDVLELRDGYKKNRYDIHVRPPEPFIPRHLRLGVDERITYTGDVDLPLSEESVQAAIALFKREGVESIAVSFLWSMVNPAHEEKVLDILSREVPDIYSVISSGILPAIREYPRTCATAVSAYVGPKLGKYLRRVADYLKENGYRYDLLVMQVTGGAATVAEIEKRPVLAIGSGPAAGPAAGRSIGAGASVEDVMVIDMGGTSFEVSLITRGEFTMTQEAEVAEMPIGVPAVEMQSIGAGGGSIAWLDSGGMLRVGPQSAGASPGPACYGLGGEAPTVTDANLVLGHLDPANVLGETIKLNRDLAERAVSRIAGPLGLSTSGAAAAIYNVVNSNMVGAMRAVSVMRGVDPRNYTIVNGGGAGGLHVAKMAESLGVRKVISPAVAGGLCAFGMLAGDVRQSHLVTAPTNSSAFDVNRVNLIFADMESKARSAMMRQGFSDDNIKYERSVDAKYPYQTHHLMVRIPGGNYGSASAAELATLFHDVHQRLYSYSLRDQPVDMNGWHLVAIGRLPDLPTASARSGADVPGALVHQRDVYDLHGGGYVSAPVYDGTRLLAGMRIDGRAIVELPTTTITLFPEHSLLVQPNGDFHITVGAEAETAVYVG